MRCNFLVASCVPDGGVYKCTLYDDGTVDIGEKISMPSPMYIQLDGSRLWAVLRAPFDDSNDSGVAAYDIETGERLTEIFSTKGEVGCHIAASGKDVYCANYIGGSVFKVSDVLDAHEGQGVDPQRQLSPHPHSVVISPDGKYLLSCDLGLDKIIIYDRQLRALSHGSVPDGSGARHLVFSHAGDYIYCVNEMGGSISVFRFADGLLEYVNTVSVMPADFCGIAAAAAIKISQSGERLYITERATQKIVTLGINNAELTVLARTGSKGREPRDFTLLANDKYAVCTNQFENSVSVFKMCVDETPEFMSSFNVKSPLCAVGM